MVNIRDPCEKLVVSSGIGHRQKTSIPGVLLDRASENPRSEAAGTGSGSRGSSEHQHSWLAQGFLEEMMLISAGFSVAVMGGAVGNSLSQVLL